MWKSETITLIAQLNSTCILNAPTEQGHIYIQGPINTLDDAYREEGKDLGIKRKKLTEEGPCMFQIMIVCTVNQRI